MIELVGPFGPRVMDPRYYGSRISRNFMIPILILRKKAGRVTWPCSGSKAGRVTRPCKAGRVTGPHSGSINRTRHGVGKGYVGW